MRGQGTNFWKSRAFVKVPVLALVLATFFYALDRTTTIGCSLVAQIGWVLPEVLRPMVEPADWQPISMCPPQSACSLQNVIKIGEALGSLL
jgi:hypothetical protein